jgi:hypothetical protein
MSGFTMADFTITVDEETGHRVAKFAVDSNMLPVEQPDMYSTYNGDYFTERYLENMEEDGQPSDYDDYDWTYDSSAVCRKLSEVGAQDVVNQLSSEGIIRSVEVESTWSPREYNFATDSYKAVWEFDLDLLEAWAKENRFNDSEYVKKYHSSYDGFMSYVEDWMEDERYVEGSTLWLTLAAYLRMNLDLVQQEESMREVEYEAWDETTTITLKTED